MVDCMLKFFTKNGLMLVPNINDIVLISVGVINLLSKWAHHQTIGFGVPKQPTTS